MEAQDSQRRSPHANGNGADTATNGNGTHAVAERRQCPTIVDRHEVLITHSIGTGQCMQRQREHYHKCHRCAYRGKPASFRFDAPDASSPASRNGSGRGGDLPGSRA